MNIIFTAGGTGGHIFPLLALYSILRQKCVAGKFYFLGQSEGRERKLAEDSGIPFLGFLKQSNQRGNIFQIIWALFLAFIALFRCLFLLFRLKPDLIVGGGGYASFPVLCAAFLLRKPFVLLEQNMIPGKVTRLFARFSRATFFSFPGSEKGILARKKLVLGNPVREELICDKVQAREKLYLKCSATLVVLVGGSKGSKALNEAALEFVPRLIKHFPSLSVFWVTGEEQFNEIAAKVEVLSPNLFLVPFEKNLPLWLAAADLYVGRAGAGLISEITACGLPSILIPYPFAAERHQLANALYLEQNGASIILEEERLSRLGDQIEKLLASPEFLQEMRERTQRLGRPKAASDIADWIAKEIEA